MNILYTESSPNIGGQELQAVAQMCAMRRLGHQVMLACREHSRISAEAHRYGIPVVHIPFRNSLHPPSVLALRRLIVTFRPEWWSATAVMTAISSALPGEYCPVVRHVLPLSGRKRI